MYATTNIPTRGDCVVMLQVLWEGDERAAFDVGRDAVGDPVRDFERTLDVGRDAIGDPVRDFERTLDVGRDAVGDLVRVFERTLELARDFARSWPLATVSGSLS